MDALDNIPARPAMPKVSRVLHNSSRYNACLVAPGLIVQSNHTGTGKLLPRTHAQFQDYLAAFDTALDAKEADALCKALL